MEYSNRLKELGLPTLQYRRLRYNMLQFYKIQNVLYGIDNIENADQKLVLSQHNITRGHSLHPEKPRCNTDRHSKSFFFCECYKRSESFA